jgi:hypothetical protein
MKTEEIKTLKVELDGDDADRFKSAIKKVQEQESKAGFNNSVLNAEEKVLIKSLSEKLNP